MSLKFLALKGWHPANKANQKRIWVAEQKAKQREEREREAAAEVRKNADALHAQQTAAAFGDQDAARRVNSQQLQFLYAAPPGLPEAKGDSEESEDKRLKNQTQEDEAVREFRRKAERHNEPQRKLERYVGRRREESLTIQDQVERFPMLKDAPVEGSYTQSLRVSFNPVGVRLRNVRCIRCGQWGHQSGDRECGLKDQNPHDAARQMREDPVTEINKLKSAKQELVFRRGALPLEMQQAGAGEEFEILQSDDDDVVNAEDAFLANLSTKHKKRLLQKLKELSPGSSESDSDSDAPSQAKRKRRSDHKHKRKHKSHIRDRDREKANDRRHRKSSRQTCSRSCSQSRKRRQRSRRTRSRSPSSSSPDDKRRKTSTHE